MDERAGKRKDGGGGEVIRMLTTGRNLKIMRVEDVTCCLVSSLDCAMWEPLDEDVFVFIGA